MELEEIYRKVKENPFGSIYLRRKRKFKMGETDVIYGDHEQTDFCVVFSPDKLDTQYPLMDITAKLGRQRPISVNTDYKHEYFPMSNSDVQSCIRQETASDILDRLKVFILYADWYEPESHQS